MDGSSEEDDVLQVSDGEFSGFCSEDIVEGPTVAKTVEISTVKSASPKKSRGKSPVRGKKRAKSTKTLAKKVSKPRNKTIDIDKLSASDIEKLRKKLGVFAPEPFSDEDMPDHFGDRPNLRVEFNTKDISDDEPAGPSTSVSRNIEKELFGAESDKSDDEGEWMPPKLKSLEKDRAIASSLANLINVACTSSCDTDSMLSKYKIPENCDKAGPPLVNSEIWKVLDKKIHSLDKGIQDVQNIVVAAMIPVIKLASELKAQTSLSPECKTLVSDTLTLMGQAQYHLSLRRRYQIRPHLKKKYSSLCNLSTPITSKLFGDDVSKEIKMCDSMMNISKNDFYKSSWRGRGGYRAGGTRGYHMRSGQNRSQSYGQYGGRYQPYPQNQYYTQRGGGSRGRPYRRGSSQNMESPNDK